MDTNSETTRVLTDAQAQETRSVSGHAAAAEVREFVAGDTIGRYHVVARIGAGGMGVVYAADDCALDRRVALKLLRREPTADATPTQAQGRLVREARAMAQLSHPNVLPVFDVGMVGEQVFVAMALVTGQTLRQWCRAQPRLPAEVLTTVVAAGRGLAAAHAAGIVHRDFKPSNVLVGDDGRVLVMDFGLARATSDASIDGPLHSRSADQSVHGDLTRTGFVMGTPAYMAPEQHRGEAPDPKSDQWSFCLTLYEALFGERPFAGATRAELIAATDKADFEPPARVPSVPARWVQVLRRGLSSAPEDRYPTMDALLQALNRAATPRRVPWKSLTLGVTAVGGLGLWAFQSPPTPGVDCTRVGAPMAALWNATRRDGLRRTFKDTAVSWADDSADRVIARLDEFASTWSALRTEACQSTEEAVATAPLVACLDDQLEAMRRVVAVVGQSDGTTVQHAVHTAAGLPELSACTDPVVQTVPSGPADPGLQTEVATIEAELQRAEVLQRAARFAEALPLAERLLGRAETTGHVPTRVHAQHVVGGLRARAGDIEAGLALLEAALWLAEEHGMDRQVAELAIALLSLVHSEQHELDDAPRWAALARAKVQLVEPDGRLHARLVSVLAEAADTRGEYEEARRYTAEAIAQWERLSPGGIEHATAVANVARTYFRDQDFAAAREQFGEAARMLSIVLGQGHPDVTRLRGNVAVAAQAAGDYALARDELTAIVPRFEELFGPEHQTVAMTMSNLANAYHRLGQNDKALDVAQRALAIKRKIHGDGRDVAFSLSNTAMVLVALERFDEAAGHYGEAIDMLTIALGASHPSLVAPIEGLGEVRFKQGKLVEAETLLRRAIELEAQADTPLSSRVVPTFLLAQVLWAQARYPEATTLARQARQWAADAGDDQRLVGLVQSIDAWTAEHAEK